MSINSTMTALADAIRSKSGVTGTLSLSAMKTAVDSIPTAQKVIVTDAAYLFSGQIPEEAYSTFKIVCPTAMNHMYYLNDAILNIDMTMLDFTPNPNPILCSQMFYTNDKMISAKLPAGINARSVMSMFQGCKSLTSFDLNGINTSSCTDYRSFINGCVALKEFDGSIFPSLYVANNTCQNFFYATSKLQKIWLPKEWHMPNTTAGYSPFISNGGSNKMNANLHIYTDAVSEEQQIANGDWTEFTMVYNSSGTKIPDAQIHYGSTHDQYLSIEV